MDQIDPNNSSRKIQGMGKKISIIPQLNLMSSFQRHSLHKTRASPIRNNFASSPKNVYSGPTGTKDAELLGNNPGSSEILKIKHIPSQTIPKPTDGATSRFIGIKNEQMKKILTTCLDNLHSSLDQNFNSRDQSSSIQTERILIKKNGDLTVQQGPSLPKLPESFLTHRDKLTSRKVSLASFKGQAEGIDPVDFFEKRHMGPAKRLEDLLTKNNHVKYGRRQHGPSFEASNNYSGVKGSNVYKYNQGNFESRPLRLKTGKLIVKRPFNIVNSAVKNPEASSFDRIQSFEKDSKIKGLGIGQAAFDQYYILKTSKSVEQLAKIRNIVPPPRLDVQKSKNGLTVNLGGRKISTSKDSSVVSSPQLPKLDKTPRSFVDRDL
jgi:hypothetical protein